jgi:hypothetical protein
MSQPIALHFLLPAAVPGRPRALSHAICHRHQNYNDRDTACPNTQS